MTKLNETCVKTEAMKDRGTPEPISAMAVLACAWPALFLATACLLPFLNKPFLIDDPISSPWRSRSSSIRHTRWISILAGTRARLQESLSIARPEMP